MEKEKSLIKMTNEEFDKFMCNKFPELFADRNKPMTQTCMCWGFNIGEGWNQILFDLCIKLDFIRKQTGILTVFDQIKEKFGSGRFYYHITAGDCKLEEGIRNIWCDFIEDAVNKAERESDHTCAACGEQYFHDKITIGGWVYDLCKDCLLNSKKDQDIAEVLENNEKHKDRISHLVYIIECMDEDNLSHIEKICCEIEEKTSEGNGTLMKTIIT